MNLSGVEPFKYKPLTAEKQEIHLFRLKIGADQRQLKGYLEHYDLDACPEYRALSYEWGSDVRNQRLLINDCSLLIGDNLRSFLHHFSQLATNGRRYTEAWLYAKPSHYLWIDHICIDQSSVRERGHQVQLMSRSFQQATATVAWLGTSSSAVGLLTRDLERGGDDDSSIDMDATVTREPLEAAFLQLPYWNRLWIQQELMLAQSLFRG